MGASRLLTVACLHLSREYNGTEIYASSSSNALASWREDRWDEAAGLSRDVVAYAAPQEHPAVNAARRPAMDHIGIDVHKRESQIYILAEGGEVIEQRIRTEPERFAAVLGSRPRARIVIEASTDSEWVARCLERIANMNALRRRSPRPWPPSP